MSTNTYTLFFSCDIRTLCVKKVAEASTALSIKNPCLHHCWSRATPHKHVFQNLSPMALSLWPCKNTPRVGICSILQQAHQQNRRHTTFLLTSWPTVMVNSLQWEDPLKASSYKTRLWTLQTLLLMHALCPCHLSFWCSGCSNPSVSLWHSESHSSMMSSW